METCLGWLEWYSEVCDMRKAQVSGVDALSGPTAVGRKDNPSSWTPVWPKNLGCRVLGLSSHGSMGLSLSAKPGHFFTWVSLLIPMGSHLLQVSTHRHWIPLRENVKKPWAEAQAPDRILGSGFYRDGRSSYLQPQLTGLKQGLWKDTPLLPTSEQKRN